MLESFKQPLMTLMFGNLTLAFVQFGTAVQNAFAAGAGPAAMQEFNDAASAFKRAAADDALYLACIGTFPLLSLPSRAHQLAFATVAIPIVSVDTRSQRAPPAPNPTPTPPPPPFHLRSLFFGRPSSSGVSARPYHPGCRALTLHFRYWFDCDHLYFHVNMDIHGRNQCEAHP